MSSTDVVRQADYEPKPARQPGRGWQPGEFEASTKAYIKWIGDRDRQAHLKWKAEQEEKARREEAKAKALAEFDDPDYPSILGQLSGDQLRAIHQRNLAERRK
jgi:hypothetical protein